MKINSLNIYGFGKLQNLKINFNENINIIYGENEAGKTTIMQFIKQILFGFPTKNSLEKNYPPIRGGAYGGSLNVAHNGEIYIIERIALNKACGEVKIIDKSGNELPETFLSNEILKGITHSSFCSIFHFGLDGVQQITKLSGDDIGNYLLSSSLLGSYNPEEDLKTLIKSRDEIFKANGKNQEINRIILELNDIDKQFIPESEGLYEFNKLIEDKKNLETNIKKLNYEINDLEQKKQCYELQKRLNPLIQQRNTLIESVEACKHFEEVEFTDLQNTVGEINDLNRQLNSNLKAYKEHEVRYNGISSVCALKELDNNKDYILEDFSQLDKRLTSLSQLENEKNNLINELNEISSELGSRRQIYNSKKTHFNLELQVKIRNLVTEYESTNKSLTSLGFEYENTKENLKVQYEQIDEKLKNSRVKNRNNFTIIISILTLLIAGVMLYESISNVDKLQIIFSSLLTLGSLYFFVSNVNTKKDNNIISIEENIRFNEKKLGNYQNNINQLKNKLEGIIDSVNEILDQFGLSVETEIIIVPRLVELLNKVATIETKLNMINLEIEKINLLENTIRNKWRTYISNLHIKSKTPSEILSSIIHKVEEYRKEEVINQKIEEKYNEIVNNTRYLKSALENNHLIFNTLAKGCCQFNNYEEFVGKYNRYLYNLSELAKVEKIIEEILSEGNKINIKSLQLDNDIERKISEVDQGIRFSRNELNSLMSMYGSTTARIEDLQKNDTLDFLNQKYENKKEELFDLSKKWASHSVAIELIKRTISKYRNERLPETLLLAQEYFSILTDQQYTVISVSDENGRLIINSNDGIAISPSDLSKGTQEQLYVSLRLALVVNISKQTKLPIIIDDAFVNFDGRRQENVFNLFKVLSKQVQIIYFTCHYNFSNLFDKINLITLEKERELR
ncbi:MAG: hypothetical protein K0S51_986 [Bacillales bacterium]|jgi:uncharacterized protein YhaN|nr:hypothetical protein [Bacillales bacterium]